MADGARARFVRQSMGVFGTQLVVTALGLGTSVITARALGPHDRGLFQLLVILPTTLSNFVKFGIPQATVYFIRRRGAAVSQVASTTLAIGVILGGGLALGCWLARDWLLGNLLKGVPQAALVPSLVALPFVLLQTYFLGVVQAQERFREYSLQLLAPTLLGLIGMAVALLWLRTGLMGAIVTQSAIVVGVSAWLLVRVHRHAPLHATWQPALVRGMLGFGGKSYLQTLAATLHLRLDQYIIAALLDPAQVGLYAVAVNMNNLLLKVPEATGTVLFPRLAKSAEAEAHAATSRVCRHTLFVTGVLALGCAVAGPTAVRVLYGSRFAGAITPMLLMLPGIVTMSLYLILTRNFTSRNRQGVNIVAALAALGINFGLNLVLIPRWGIAGAAMSHTVSYSVAAMILLVAFVRESGHTVRETVLVRGTEIGDVLRAARAVVPGRVRVPARGLADRTSPDAEPPRSARQA